MGGLSRRLQSIVLGVALLAGVGIGVGIEATRSSGAAESPVFTNAAVTNPVLDPTSPERAEVTLAGVEVAVDGLEIEL